jgi:hypothetical protein
MEETVPDSLLPLLTTAAELRASGHSWTKVGEDLNRSPETCRHWPLRFPETWRRLYRRAQGHVIAEAGAEARAYLRKLLRGAEARYVLGAAQALLRCEENERSREERAERTNPPEGSAEIPEFVRHLKGMTAAQLAALIDDYLALVRPAVEATAAGGPEPPAPPLTD